MQSVNYLTSLDRFPNDTTVDWARAPSKRKARFAGAHKPTGGYHGRNYAVAGNAASSASGTSVRKSAQLGRAVHTACQRCNRGPVKKKDQPTIDAAISS